MGKTMKWLIAILLIVPLALGACAPQAAPEATEEAAPETEADINGGIGVRYIF